MKINQTPMPTAALAGAAAVLLAGVPLVIFHELGHLSQHMALHILSMNVAAPFAAIIIVARAAPRTLAPKWLWAIACMQILALWFLHTPRFHSMAAHNAAMSVSVQGVLACLALAFWIALMSLGAQQRWHAPAALLLTGKLACLLAALLIFAPRLLYTATDHQAHVINVSLADQQLAGLLMIVACPLSYLTAAVLITLALIGSHESASVRAADDETPRYAP